MSLFPKRWAVGKAVELSIAGQTDDIEATARRLLAIQQRIERGDSPPAKETSPNEPSF